MDQNYLDSSAFAVVFLRAKDAGAAVLNMLFLTPGISFDVDLGLLCFLDSVKPNKIYRVSC